MASNISTAERTIAIQRLTALWALNECGLGGFLHALQAPFTGLLVGSIAMICIAFICSFSGNNWQTVMTSLVIVLVVKALVSPHSSPTAYIAVIFQGVTGAVIYRFIPGLLFSSLLFVSLGLIESAVQRLLTLTILYGNSIWNAINIWGEWVAGQWGVILPFSSARLIILFYLGVHVLTGIAIGYFIYRIILSVRAHWGDVRYQLILSVNDKKGLVRTSHKNKLNWRRYILFFAVSVLIVFAYSIQNEGTGFQNGIIAILRAMGILTLWFVFVAPLAIHFIKKWLQNKHHQLALEISSTLDMFPQIIWIIDKAWKETQRLPFINRWPAFLLHSFLYILQYTSHHDPDIDRSDPKQ